MIKQIHHRWWKITTVVLLIYAHVAGLLFPTPDNPTLRETVRNLYFHVPLWFAMTGMLLISLVYSVKFLRTPHLIYDAVATELAKVSIVFGTLGFLTGMLWGNYTWGDVISFLSADTKILGAFIGLLIYLAYFVLRSSIDDEEKRARIAAVYSIFAYTLLIVFIFVIPRMTDTLHPGSGGNPGFNIYDLDKTMRLVFYPAVVGMMGLGLWISSILIRLKIIHYRFHHIDIVRR